MSTTHSSLIKDKDLVYSSEELHALLVHHRLSNMIMKVITASVSCKPYKMNSAFFPR